MEACVSLCLPEFYRVSHVRAPNNALHLTAISMPFIMVGTLSNGIVALTYQQTPLRHDGRLCEKQPGRQSSNKSLWWTPLVASARREGFDKACGVSRIIETPVRQGR